MAGIQSIWTKFFAKQEASEKEMPLNSVPNWINENLKSSEYVRVKTAKKLIHFLEEAPFPIPEGGIEKLYLIVEEREICNFKAKMEYPHLPTIMNQIRSECFDTFTNSIDSLFTQSEVEYIRNHFQGHREKATNQ